MGERVKRDNTVAHKTVPCQFCKKHYLEPCKNERMANGCGNYVWLREKAQQKAERVKPKGKKR